MSTEKPTFYVGTAIEITTILGRNSPSAVTATITDANGVVKVTAAAMTAGGDKIYIYVWQSASTDTVGDYIAEINATYGIYTAKSKASFELIE